MRKLQLIVLFVFTLLSVNLVAQSTNSDLINLDTTSTLDNWFNLDPYKDSIQGISTDQAYELLLKDKSSRTVIVAVIDSGIDIDHEDLKGSIWTNEKEIDGNGVDDDQNGYVDDIHGWNFLGNTNGDNITSDSYELTREYVRLISKFDNEKKIKKKNKKEHQYFLQVKKEFERQKTEAEKELTFFNEINKSFELVNGFFDSYFKGHPYSEVDIRAIETEDQMVLQAKQFMIITFENGITKDVLEQEGERVNKSLAFAFNLDYDPRSLIGDDYSNLSEKGYGNNNVEGPDASHGTHVAGIIAANRNNALGIKGVADNVKIMAIRAVPDGDERDKDIANAIFYAVNNGAQIINMSFGKSYSPNKDVIDKAVKYAADKGVLLIHAAGNSSKNIDVKNNYPTPVFQNGKGIAENWIEVGASSQYLGKDLAGSFSNYGQNIVDVFAPGVAITSTTPNQNYEIFDGTSMAAPATTGLAALLMSYYPSLSNIQIRDIILSSGVNHKSLDVKKPTSDGKEKNIPFGELSKTGSIINAYNAVEMAESITNRQ